MTALPGQMHMKKGLPFRLISQRQVLFLTAAFLSVFLVCSIYNGGWSRSGWELVVYREMPLVPGHVRSTFQLNSPINATTCLLPRSGKPASQKCKKCAPGKFRLPGWFVCRNFLECSDFHNNVRVRDTLYHYGNHKHYQADWESFQLVLVCSEKTSSFANVHSKLVDKVSTFQNFFQIVGFCSHKACTAYYPYNRGPWTPLLQVVGETSWNSQAEGSRHWYARFIIMYNLVEVLSNLHDGLMSGVYAMCNTNSVAAILSKFVVNGNGLVQVAHLNGFIPTQGTFSEQKYTQCTDNSGTPSGGRDGDMLQAPEVSGKHFSHTKLSLDESAVRHQHTMQIDVWLIPDVAQFLLHSVPGGPRILDYLEKIHRQCKFSNPQERPSMDEVRDAYMDVLWYFINS